MFNAFEETAAFLQSAHSLNYMVFKTEFGHGIPPQITVQHEMIKSEDEATVKAMGFGWDVHIEELFQWHGIVKVWQECEP